MKKVNFIKKLIRPLKSRYQTCKYLKKEFTFTNKYYGAYNTCKDSEKWRYSIIIQVHIIEKGLSLKDCRPGFGIPKAIALLDSCYKYYKIYEDVETLSFVLSVIKKYIEFNRQNGIETKEIIQKYTSLVSFIEKKDCPTILGGDKLVFRKDVEKAIAIPYFDFVKSRHSIRTFSDKKINKSMLEKALEIAAYTPSACNRQPWGAHIFTNKENIIKILDIQTGARQFKEMVGALIIVTSTRKAFYGGEYNQWLVNGGMYAMSLIHAIHSVGLGCIPLNLGIPNDRIKQIWQIGKIDDSEVPIVLLAVGHLPDEFKVATSYRFPIKNYVTFD